MGRRSAKMLGISGLFCYNLFLGMRDTDLLQPDFSTVSKSATACVTLITENYIIIK